jgi:hypothetical protein
MLFAISYSSQKKKSRRARFFVTVQCGRARSHIPAGVNPAPARQASYWIEDPGLAEVIPKVKHGAIKTTGRKRKLK